jgi:CheY-like chemotaxis protein
VDDNRDAAESLAMLLQLEGHTVETAFDPRQALERAPLFLPDVVLLDIGMPEMDGFEVAHRMRALPQLARAFLVALTGYGRTEDRDMTAAAGFDAHLVKPVDLGALARVLAAVRCPAPPVD